jgi:predicted  nucleic acid-binding Zn-ribbon protein
MIADLQLVIQLQGLDLKLTKLEKEIALLPKQIAAIERALDSQQRKLEADRAALSANQRERKKIEGDVQTNEGKISKLRDQMLQAKNNEQYKAFQHEIDFCLQEVKKCEDRTIVLMEESEPLERNVKAAESELKKEKVAVDAEKALASEKTAASQKEHNELTAKRMEVVKEISPAVMVKYDRLRKKHKNGIAVSEVIEGRCHMCQISLRPQYFQEVRHNNDVLPCEMCMRLLFYNPPTAVDHDLYAGGTRA